MKKTIIAIVAIGFMAFQQNTAQAQAYQKGDKLVNIGLGLGAYTIKEGLFSTYTTHSGVGLGASGEYGVTDDISAGALFGFSRYSKAASRNVLGGAMNFLHFGGRASYHFGNILKLQNDKIDVYAGAGIGLRFFTLSIDGATAQDVAEIKAEYKKLLGISTIFIPVHVGGRYYFKDNMAAFAELSTGFSVFQGGISFKF
jgi:hypothetical protein